MEAGSGAVEMLISMAAFVSVPPLLATPSVV
jgi:hypothetical protein